MRKLLLMLMLTIAVLTTACAAEDGKNTTEEPQKTENSEEQTTEEPQKTENSEEQTTEKTTEQTEIESEEKAPIDQETVNKWNDYLASVKEQADMIKASLEKDPLSQNEMNMKSEELFGLWDGALNYLWGELKERLPEDEFAKLLDEQRVWIAEKEKAVEEAGKGFEGGSMYPLLVNQEAADLTEARVYELLELFK